MSIQELTFSSELSGTRKVSVLKKEGVLSTTFKNYIDSFNKGNYPESNNLINRFPGNIETT